MIRDKIKNLIGINVISLLLLGFSIGAYFLFGIIGFIVMIIVTAIYALTANYKALMEKPDNPTAGLEKFRKEPTMKTDIDAIIIAYKSIEQRKVIFDNSDSVGAMEIYEKARGQVENNIGSAIKFCDTYDYITKPGTGYLHGLAIECTEIVSKLNEIIVERIDVENSVRDEDIRIMDDYLESLRTVKGQM